MRHTYKKQLIFFYTLSTLLILPVFSSVCVLAAEYNVPAEYATIQAAINIANDGDRIVVQPGVYTENINYYGKALLITSTDPFDPSIVSSTIIDGNQTGSVLTFNSGETSASILTGFTVRGGNGVLKGDGKRYGGGIYCGVGTKPTIRHNNIINNIADIGGAIYIEGNTPPVIAGGPSADYPYVGKGSTVGLSVTASDNDGDTLIYDWIPQNGGTISGTGSTVLFSALSPGVYNIDLSVNDQRGGTATGSVTVTVIGIDIQTPLPQLLVGEAANISANALPSISDSPEYPVTITWSVIEGPASGIFDTISNGKPEASSITFTPAASGPGRIQVEYRIGSAVDTDSQSMALIPIVSNINPASGIQGNTVQASIAGYNLGRVNGISLTGTGVTAGILAGQTENVLPVQFIINATAEPGNSSIILTTPEGQFNTLTVFQIIPLPSITGSPSSLNLIVGENSTLIFTIPDPAPIGGKSLILSSSAPIVASIPGSVTIPENETSAEVTVTALGYGSTVMTANASGYSKAQIPVAVINAPLITLSPSPLTVASGLVEKCTISISNPAPAGGVTVNLSGGAGIIEIPASITITENKTSTTFNIKGLSEGTSTLNVNANGYPEATMQINVTPAQLNLFPDNISIGAGRSSSLQLTIPNSAPAGGLAVSISSSNTNFVTVPSMVTIPEGQSSVYVSVNGAGVGSALITASLTGFPNAQATVNVLSEYSIAFLTTPLYMPPGVTKTTNVVISTAAPEGGMTITLSNPNPDKVSVPETIYIPEGTYAATISVTGLAESNGEITITATCPGLSDGYLGVNVQPVLSLSLKADVTVGYGTKSTGLVMLTSGTAPTGGYTVNLTSDDPLVASVPATVTIAEGAGYKSFTIVGQSVGTTVIRMSVSGFTEADTVRVVKPTFTWGSVPAQITLGATTNVYVYTYVPGGTYYYSNGSRYNKTDQVVDSALTVSVSSEDYSVIQAPATVSITAGKSSKSFSIQAAGVGTSTITASADGWDSKPSATEIEVIGPTLKATVTVGDGTRSTGLVAINGAAPTGGYTVNLTSDDPAIASVPATVTIAEGAGSKSFTIVGQSVGSTVIRMSVSGLTAANTVTVVKPTFTWSSVPAQITLGATTNVYVYTYVPGGTYYYSNGSRYNKTDQVVDSALTVSVSSEDYSVIQAPATVSITAGKSSKSFSIQAAGVGTSTITASAAGWDNKTSSVITVVGLSPTLYANVKVGDGTRSTGLVAINGAAPTGGYTVNLTSDDPAIASVPATVSIAAGKSNKSFTIVGQSVGSTVIRMSVSGLTAANTVTVVKPTFTWGSVPAQITLGATTNVYVYTYVPGGTYYYSNGSRYNKTDQVVDSALTVSVSSEDSSVIQAPATVSITAGKSNKSFSIQAAGVGTSTITASADGWDSKISSVITVVGLSPTLYANVKVGDGTRSTGLVVINGAAPTGGYTVNLTSDDPLVASVPATVTIAEGAGYKKFTIVGQSVGTTVIRMSVSGFTEADTVRVVKPTFTWGNVPTQMTIGTNSTVYVYTYVPGGTYYHFNGTRYNKTSQVVDSALTVSVSSEDSSVIQAPATASITAGKSSKSFSIQAAGVGTSTITASATGWDSNTSATAIEVIGPTLKATVTVGAGTRTTGLVVLTGGTAPTGGYTVNLTSDDPAVASVPATVTIAEGAGYKSFTIVGQSVGTTVIRMSVSGFTEADTVRVVKPTFTWGSVPTQMTIGTNSTVYVYTYVPGGTSYYSNGTRYNKTSQVVDSALTVSVSSEDSSVIQAPATASITAGKSSKSFSIQAAGVGTSTITASAAGWDSNTSSVITVP